MSDFNLGFRYNFNTLAPAILGATFTNAKVLALLNYDTATMFGNIAATAVAVYPLLPAGTPSDPTAYQYVIIETENKSKVVLALNWIDTNSIVSVESVNANFKISNITLDDINKITTSLVAMGYTQITTSTM
jgi:hypothetical protein